VTFDVNVHILHPATLARFQQANAEALALKKEIEQPHAGNYGMAQSRLGPAPELGHFPWQLQSTPIRLSWRPI